MNCIIKKTKILDKKDVIKKNNLNYGDTITITNDGGTVSFTATIIHVYIVEEPHYIIIETDNSTNLNNGTYYYYKLIEGTNTLFSDKITVKILQFGPLFRLKNNRYKLPLPDIRFDHDIEQLKLNL